MFCITVLIAEARVNYVVKFAQNVESVLMIAKHEISDILYISNQPFPLPQHNVFSLILCNNKKCIPSYTVHLVMSVSHATVSIYQKATFDNLFADFKEPIQCCYV